MPTPQVPVAPVAPQHPTAAPIAGGGVLPPHVGVQQPAYAAPVPVSVGARTAPQSSAAPVVADMPVSWPVPTKMQQKHSTTTSVAGANQAIQELSVGGSASVAGEPMPAADLNSVRNTLTMLLEASAQDGNVRKKEDNSKRLEDLYSKLATGQVKTVAAQKVLELVRKVDAQDYVAVGKIAQELFTCDWEQNKFWLQGIKRLLPAR